MFLRTQNAPSKTFIGKSLTMSFAHNRTFELWRSFMPDRKNVPNVIGTELYSMEVYPEGFHNAFDPTREFEKWAAVEVLEGTIAPEGMQTLIAPAGEYAVFLHKGPASEGAKTYGYIFGEWLPMSGYRLDNRPHFAVMGEKYKNDSPDSEEEIWIPIA